MLSRNKEHKERLRRRLLRQEHADDIKVDKGRVTNMKRLPSWRFEPLAACQRNKGVCPSSEYMLWCGSNNGGNLILICTFNIRNFLRKTAKLPLRHVERGQRLQLLRVCGCQVREVFITVCVSWSLLHVNQPRSDGSYIPIPSSFWGGITKSRGNLPWLHLQPRSRPHQWRFWQARMENWNYPEFN